MKVGAKKLFEAVEQSYNSAVFEGDVLNSSPAPLIEGLELLQGKQIKNPFREYNLLSQLWLNALKYGDGKQIEVKIEKNIMDQKGGLLISFTNPETPALPNAAIKEIIKGKGARAVSKKNSHIEGTGTGISQVVKILESSGHKQYVQTLFEMDREKGVRVSVPIVGLQ